MTWCLRSLPKATTCTKCATRLPKEVQAWCFVGSSPLQVRCVTCGYPNAYPGADVGWYLFGVLLASELPHDITVVPQYAASPTMSPVGHVILAPSGIWLVNALKVDGVVSVSTRTSTVKIANVDRTNLLDHLVMASCVVAEMLPGLPLHPALALVDATWSDADSSRLKRQGPFMMRTVSISGPHSILEAIIAEGPLDSRVLAAARRRLGSAAK